MAIHRLGYVSQDRMFQEVQVWHGKSGSPGTDVDVILR